MFEYKYKINNEIIEYLTEQDLSIEQILEITLPEKEIINGFYYEPEKFIKNNIKNFKKRKINKKIYYVFFDIKGFDTYDSAVFIGYNKNQVIDLIEQNLGNKYSNISYIKEIGKANKEEKIGMVIASFNAG